MAPLRPWYCEYEVHDNGRVRLRIVWSETPTVAHSKEFSFPALDDLPSLLREAVASHREANGGKSGAFDFPDGWGQTDLEAALASSSAAASPSR